MTASTPGPLTGRRIGVAMSASHCNLDRAFVQVRALKDAGAELVLVLSKNAVTTPTRFGTPDKWEGLAQEITGQPPLTTIPEVEPFGPKIKLDCLVVMPCTGNTLAKLANAINDTPVCMAVKAQLRNHRAVVLAITTNDALGMNAKNLGTLLAAKGVYFVPFGQDNPHGKPNSLDARIEEFLLPTMQAAMDGQQLQPLLLGPTLAGV